MVACIFNVFKYSLYNNYLFNKNLLNTLIEFQAPY